MTPILKESRKQCISIQAFKKPLRFVAILTFKAIAQGPTASYNAILRPSTPKNQTSKPICKQNPNRGMNIATNGLSGV